MKQRIEILSQRKLLGQRMTMSFAENKTTKLWSSFMPRRKEITNNIGPGLYSLQVYAPSFFDQFDPEAVFEKWAAVEVTDYDKVPTGMEPFILPGGLYSVFLYHGSPGAAPVVFQYIFSNWLPQSGYILDNRPHFEILGERYKNDDPDSEEEIWIPIKPCM